MSEPFGQKKTLGLAITSLVLGILGFVCCGFFSGIPAIICGHMAHGKIHRHPRRYEGSGLALAGLILGYLSIFSTGILAALAIPAEGAMQLQMSVGAPDETRRRSMALYTRPADAAPELFQSRPRRCFDRELSCGCKRNSSRHSRQRKFADSSVFGHL